MNLTPDHQTELETLQHKYRDKPAGNIIFYGSSSIRMWFGLSRALPGVAIENWGFGGSTLRECCDAFERFIVPRAPRGLVVYAGDNDLALGATPEAVWEALRDLLQLCDARLPAVPVAFLSLKISRARAELRDQIEQTNAWCQREIWAHPRAQWVEIAAPMLDANGQPRAELFVDDGLHLSRAGYAVWNNVVRREVSWLSPDA